MHKRISFAVVIFASALGGCASHIVPLFPMQRVQEWVPDEAPPSTAPATAAATQTAQSETQPATLALAGPTSAPAAATAPESEPAIPTTATAASTSAASTSTASAPATQPGHLVSRLIDPNQSARFVYKATYDTVWQQATLLLTNMGFSLDRRDYRLGVLTTNPLLSAQIIEFWKPQQVNSTDSLENTINNQRRTVRLTISKVAGKADFYQIAIQVLVERQNNPTEDIRGPVFVEGSGFGRDAITLRSDYLAPGTPNVGKWLTLGHDPDMENKLLDALFKHI